MTDAPGAALRDAVRADLEWIAAQEAEIFGPSAWSATMIREDWERGIRAYRIAERAGERAGYSVCGLDGDAFSLLNLAVKPAHRRCGIARALLEDCLARAALAGEPHVWLEVAVDNAAALALYRDRGFTDVRIRRRYYQPEGTDALVMKLTLAAREPAPTN